MKYRRLRIAWSVFWGLAAVLLIMLWVRSYSRDDFIGYNYEPSYGFGVVSSLGKATFTNYDGRGYTGRDRITTKGFYRKSFDASDYPGPQWGFGVKAKYSPATYLTVPHWSLAGMLIILAAGGSTLRICWRFSIRTLLIATTLIAVLLGLVVWAVGK